MKIMIVRPRIGVLEARHCVVKRIWYVICSCRKMLNTAHPWDPERERVWLMSQLWGRNVSSWTRIRSYAPQAIDSNDWNSEHSFLKVLVLAFWVFLLNLFIFWMWLTHNERVTWAWYRNRFFQMNPYSDNNNKLLMTISTIYWLLSKY